MSLKRNVFGGWSLKFLGIHVFTDPCDKFWKIHIPKPKEYETKQLVCFGYLNFTYPRYVNIPWY